MSNLQVKRKCERADLVAIVPKLTYWYVSDDGDTSDFRDDGEYDGIEQYVCFNCSECFVPDKPGNRTDEAWEAALAHIYARCQHLRFAGISGGNDKCMDCGLVVETAKEVA